MAATKVLILAFDSWAVSMQFDVTDQWSLWKWHLLANFMKQSQSH